LRKSGGKVKPDYELPDFPEEMAYIYNWYKALTWSEVKPTEIQAYFNGIGVKPKPWEFELLLALDRDTRSD